MSLDPRSLPELERTARAAADAAAEVHRARAGRFDAESAVEKAHSDFVSDVDLEAQAAALAVIRNRHPHHLILAEEDDGVAGARGENPGEEDASDARPVWIVDPLDGTTNYLHGHPMYCASVGVVVGGVPLAGAVTAPATGERWWAHAGGGAWKSTGAGNGGRRIRVSPLRDFRKSLIGTGFPFKVPHLLPEYLGQLDRVLRATSGIRRGGSAALDFCYLAEGMLDGFWELWLSPWDVAAGAVILAEAGGVIARVDGSEAEIEVPGSFMAANSPEIMRMLATLMRAA